MMPETCKDAPESPACPNRAALEREVARLRQELEATRADVQAATTEFAFSVPEPGTDMPRTTITSQVKGRGRALLRELAAAAKALRSVALMGSNQERYDAMNRLSEVLRRVDAEAGEMR